MNKLSPQLMLLALVLVISLISLLTGCNSSSTTPSTGAPTTSSAANPGTTTSAGVTINLTAQNMAFDMSTITVPVGAKVTVNFNNKDNGIPHNFAVYTDSSATTSIFKGQAIIGVTSTTYTFIAPTIAGTYFFRCDIHPTTMTGKFVVQ